MLSRGRKDDTEKKIDSRLDWFETEVVKTIEFFKNHRYYEFYEINGEEDIEVIHKNILDILKI
jgi:adenylate kinase family enzyme